GSSATTALILDTSSSSGSGGRPIRFLHRSCRQSARLERETPITSATVFIGNRPSAATAAAAVVFLTLWRVRRPLLEYPIPLASCPRADEVRELGSAKPDNPKPARPLPRCRPRSGCLAPPADARRTTGLGRVRSVRRLSHKQGQLARSNQAIAGENATTLCAI